MLGPVEDMLADGRSCPPAAARAAGGRPPQRRCGCCKLVNTLLDFSRIEAGPGRRPATSRPTSPASPPSWPASSGRPSSGPGCGSMVDCPPLPEPVYVDRDMWEKIVLNLLSNAFKFTFEGEIARAARAPATGGAVELAVRDTGIGIPRRRAAARCSSGSTGSRARGRAPTRARGIGLALVQELVELHGGTVGVESMLGEGSTFTVAVPLGSAHLPRGPGRRRRPAPATRAAAGRGASSRRRCAGSAPVPRRRPEPDRQPRRRARSAGADAGGRRQRRHARVHPPAARRPTTWSTAVDGRRGAALAARARRPTWCSPT